MLTKESARLELLVDFVQFEALIVPKLRMTKHDPKQTQLIKVVPVQMCHQTSNSNKKPRGDLLLSDLKWAGDNKFEKGSYSM